MKRLMPFWMLLVCGVLSLGCEDAVCFGGECVGDDCFEICEEFCEGEVIAAFCNVDLICECDCEFACF